MLAMLSGALVTKVSIRTLVMAVVAAGAIALVRAIARRPYVGAFIVVFITPLIAGISRGSVVPLLRPTEVVDVLVGIGVLMSLVSPDSTTRKRLKLSSTDRSILFVAVASSVVPLLWMVVRQQAIASDDLLYSVMMWKYYGIYLIARYAVRGERDIRTCLWLSMIAGAVVACTAVLQSLHAPLITSFLSKYYVNYGYAAAVSNGRGGATLGLPIAVADLLTFNLAIAVAFLARNDSRKRLLVALSALFATGALAAGEFSGAIGLLLGIVVMAVLARRMRLLKQLLPTVLIGLVVLRPVLDNRLSGFQSASGLPVSWSARWWALTHIFWPQLFSHGNFILGIRPAARVATASRAAGFIWIESGYTWLLWAGGIPLVAAFFYFVYKNIRGNLEAARSEPGAGGAASFAVVVALCVVGVLMLTDPHLTYRGSADLLFILLGLATAHEVEVRASPSVAQANVRVEFGAVSRGTRAIRR
jgi:hypothetical protein